VLSAGAIDAHRQISLRLLYAQGGRIAPMDFAFIALTIVLALSTWGGILLCERLLRQP
jgi:hypothetical protein